MMREEKKWLKFRIVTLLVFFLVLFIALITRAFQLQILSGQTLKTLAAKQHIKTLQIQPERGIIFDRNGEKLAASVMADSVCADPSKIRNPQDAADKVAPLLGLDRATIIKKISSTKNFCWLARRIPPEQARKVEALNVEGVFLIKEPKRFYPNGELAGHLLGFVGLDSTGLEGLELKYEDYLKGVPEKLAWARDAKGKKLQPQLEKAAAEQTSSYHLILTIDSRIQHLVETQLKEAVNDKGAKGGYAIVMDPRTGEILALANEPSFDPNYSTSGGPATGKNKAITDSYDPGSTFKPFLVAAALEEKTVKETDRIFCENGNYVADASTRPSESVSFASANAALRPIVDTVPTARTRSLSARIARSYETLSSSVVYACVSSSIECTAQPAAGVHDTRTQGVVRARDPCRQRPHPRGRHRVDARSQGGVRRGEAHRRRRARARVGDDDVPGVPAAELSPFKRR